jgi:hypothetical protein
MPVRKMIQEIIESKNIELLFQEVCTLRANTFEVFDRAG